MPAYIDATYYQEEFRGEPMEDHEEFQRIVRRASDVIDQVTGYKINHIGLNSLSSFVLGQVKKATAAQVEFFVLEGVEVQTTGDNLNNVSMGKFSYGKGNQINSERSNKGGVSQAVIQYLKPTGLLYSGIGTTGGNLHGYY
ncbi:hypothetical protein [Evansella tamaricis]|uniref:Phage protein n=1 Tax=Evansella tamaricis TaxID=2069301 RepID=A0ABS6JBL9_9BACI|nr:hypothetical protein [Evansella tamaricis]MBU9711066.1 hypothetical protein [Evansella tamaricis]